MTGSSRRDLSIYIREVSMVGRVIVLRSRGRSVLVRPIRFQSPCGDVELRAGTTGPGVRFSGASLEEQASLPLPCCQSTLDGQCVEIDHGRHQADAQQNRYVGGVEEEVQLHGIAGVIEGERSGANEVDDSAAEDNIDRVTQSSSEDQTGARRTATVTNEQPPKRHSNDQQRNQPHGNDGLWGYSLRTCGERECLVGLD